MTIWIILIIVFVVLGAGYLGEFDKHIIDFAQRRKAIKVAKKVVAKEVTASGAPKGFYSWPAMQVFNAYNSLPEANRPSYDIRAILVALDTKYGKEEVNRHFSTSFRSNQPTWGCLCVRRPVSESCSMPEYKTLNDEIAKIKKALRLQEEALKGREHQMVLAGLQSDLDMVGSLTQALRDERAVITGVTKEIEGGMPIKELGA